MQKEVENWWKQAQRDLISADVSSKIPSDEFDEKDAKDFLNYAHEVLAWIEKKMK